MIEIRYPPKFNHKVITQEAPGKEPVSVSLFAPTIVTPGEPFRLSISVLDGDGYPSVVFGGSVLVDLNPAEGRAIEVPFSTGRAAIASIEPLRIERVGIHRFRAVLNGATFHSNPVICRAQPSYRLYWGDPHVHTVLSRCHPDKARSLNFCYSAARYLAALDWVAAADHVSNGRCDFSKWKEQYTVCEVYNDEPYFVTLSAYEASFKGGAGGDNNAYFLKHPDMFVDDYDEGTVRTMAEKLAQKMPSSNFFIVPHHTTRVGKHGEISDDIYLGTELMPVVEIHSKWGTSEYRGNPNPLKKVHPGPSYAVDFLRRGLKFGFIGGTDTHSTMPAGKGVEHLDRFPGITAVKAQSLSRENIFHAIRNRQTYAASLERIYLDVAVNDVPYGNAIELNGSRPDRLITVTVAAPSDIRSIEIVRNGETIASIPCVGWHREVRFKDTEKLGDLALPSPYLGDFVFYYVRVTCDSGAQAWSSPVWMIL